MCITGPAAGTKPRLLEVLHEILPQHLRPSEGITDLCRLITAYLIN